MMYIAASYTVSGDHNKEFALSNRLTSTTGASCHYRQKLG